MQAKYSWEILVFFLAIFVTIFLHHSIADDSQSSNTACGLNFTSLPYRPSGECIDKNKNIHVWGSFRTTLCCRNALATLSMALGWNAGVGKLNIFLEADQWRNCEGIFSQQQQSISFDSCGFDNLYHGSGKCSGISVSDVANDKFFQDASDQCSMFGSSFDDSCRNCTGKIVVARDHLLDQLDANVDDQERGICSVATVILIAARKLSDDPSEIDQFYSCLSALDVIEPGYFKIKYSVAKTVAGILLGSIGLALLTMLVRYVSRNKHFPKPSKKTKETVTWSGLYKFSKAEIETALSFANERVSLGQGSAGQVFKGILPSGQVVAIKQIIKNSTSDSFTREVENLSRVRHPNLVCLFGCCIEDGEQYLVYEYCSAGNLAQHILRKDMVLTWERRVQILRDCALALRYLHHYIDGCIVHRDIKLTNILLSENLDAKLSDFGLAKMLGMEESKVFTDIRGTLGYMDPEYMSNAKLTCASDIYSFGIVILQLLSGQKVIDLDLAARDQLTRKAKDVSTGKRPLLDFKDPLLDVNLNNVDFESILQIAVLCVAKSSRGRPTIDVVFEELDKAGKNTQADMREKREMSASTTAQHGPLELMHV